MVRTILILAVFLCGWGSISAQVEMFYDPRDLTLQPAYPDFESMSDISGHREVATATDTYMQHMYKTIEYLSNLATPGYVRRAVKSVRLLDPKTNTYYVAARSERRWIEGRATRTGRSLDIALAYTGSKGFFTVKLPDGREAYTRDGRLAFDHTGRIVTLAGRFPFLSEDGELIPPDKDISISEKGVIRTFDRVVGTLKVTVFEDFEEMSEHLFSMDGVFFILDQPIKTVKNPSFEVLQGYSVMANVFQAVDTPFVKNGYTANMNVFQVLNEASKMVVDASGR
jgi:flagellar basal body rod protein FlgF